MDEARDLCRLPGGGTGTCPPVSKTGFCASSRTVSGSYVLRETLSRLSADGWVSSHPAGCLALGILALEPVGYWVGPGLDAKMATSVSALAD